MGQSPSSEGQLAESQDDISPAYHARDHLEIVQRAALEAARQLSLDKLPGWKPIELGASEALQRKASDPVEPDGAVGQRLHRLEERVEATKLAMSSAVAQHGAARQEHILLLPRLEKELESMKAHALLLVEASHLLQRPSVGRTALADACEPFDPSDDTDWTCLHIITGTSRHQIHARSYDSIRTLKHRVAQTLGLPSAKVNALELVFCEHVLQPQCQIEQAGIMPDAEIHARLNIAATEHRDVLQAAATGDLATLQMLAALAPEAIEKLNEYGSSSLVHAAVDGDLVAVGSLLSVGANPSGTTPDNESALYFAARHGHIAVVQMLLNHAADPNQATLSGSTPLHKAATNGHQAVMELLITAKGDVTKKTSDGKTALDMAMHKNLRSTSS